MSTFLAHTFEGLPPHGLQEHLLATAEEAEIKSKRVGLPGLGYLLGLTHDLGKFSREFQDRLAGGNAPVDHSTFGSKLLAERYERIGKLLAYAVAGHHAGMPNGEDGSDACLMSRLRRTDIPDAWTWQQDAKVSSHMPLQPPTISISSHPRAGTSRRGFQLAHVARMGLSCLVDADRIDTERWALATEGRYADRAFPALAALSEQVDAHMAVFKADTEVRRIRAAILAMCRAATNAPPGVFSLTVPTGGGKTLASLVWAMGHALQHGLDRIIYVIPFTSVIEQTAEVFRTAFGPYADCVIEHHSVAREWPEANQAQKIRRATENWDAPIVVTTNVQFFESLFSNTPRRCRKLHNISGSVVILDEVQTIGADHLLPCVAMLDELALNYRTSILLCTATQPTISDLGDDPRSLRGGLHKVQHIVPNTANLHERLRRVSVRVHTDTKGNVVGELDDAAIIGALRQEVQALCIVNTREHAAKLFCSLRDAGANGAAHLSALMCPAHRSEKLASYRRQLREKRPLLLITTALIEAGVDIDFPRVWRCIAGLGSIAQAAGRCNREGLRNPRDSIVTVFAPAEGGTPEFLRDDVAAAKFVLDRYRDDPISPDAIDAFYSYLYRIRAQTKKGLDAKRIMSLHEGQVVELLFPFADIAKKMRLIDNDMLPVVIAYDEEARRLIRELEVAESIKRTARKLQRYMVQLPKDQHECLRDQGAIAAIAPDKYGADWWTLKDLARYDFDMLGLDPLV